MKRIPVESNTENPNPKQLFNLYRLGKEFLMAKLKQQQNCKSTNKQ